MNLVPIFQIIGDIQSLFNQSIRQNIRAEHMEVQGCTVRRVMFAAYKINMDRKGNLYRQDLHPTQDRVLGKLQVRFQVVRASSSQIATKGCTEAHFSYSQMIPIGQPFFSLICHDSRTPNTQTFLQTRLTVVWDLTPSLELGTSSGTSGERRESGRGEALYLGCRTVSCTGSTVFSQNSKSLRAIEIGGYQNFGCCLLLHHITEVKKGERQQLSGEVTRVCTGFSSSDTVEGMKEADNFCTQNIKYTYRCRSGAIPVINT